MTLSRRRFFALAGAGTAGAAALALPGCSSSAAQATDSVPFYGEHQAGIITPVQDRLHFAAFDVTTQKRSDLVDLLKKWTTAAEAMTLGRDIGEFGAMDGPRLAPPEDTGEAYGLHPARLTLTFGFGPDLFQHQVLGDRFALGTQRPDSLRTLPRFPGDKLDDTRSGGDLCVQACSDDPQVAVHAIRNLVRIGFGRVALRWSQLGFGSTSLASTSQVTPRNLFGFKDGTNNLDTQDRDLLNKFVWVGSSSAPKWLRGGSYLVARRINMRIETWDRISLQEQEAIIGRHKKQGSPLSGGREFTEPNFASPGDDGEPIIPNHSHLRLAHPAQNGGSQMLRRGYNFADGSNDLGQFDAGLFFMAYTSDPVAHFIPIQTRLASNDRLNEYIQHTGSGLFAIPPGIAHGGFIGDTLFGGSI
jgi:deferrochelatase/peroxidase EfeB